MNCHIKGWGCLHRGEALFWLQFCIDSPFSLPKLVATFFQSLGWGQSAFSADADDAAAQLMLSVLKDMGKEMPPRWQSMHMDRVIQSLVRLLPQSKALLTQVCMPTLL